MAPDQFDGDEQADTAPADASVCVVATQEETFDRCGDGIYPSPTSYDRTNQSFEYMAFYRTAPVSAVTHYAPVIDRVEQHRDGQGPMTETDWEQLIDPFSDELSVVVFELGNLVALDTPIENDRNGIRGAWYCTVDALRTARTVSELAEQTRG